MDVIAVGSAITARWDVASSLTGGEAAAELKAEVAQRDERRRVVKLCFTELPEGLSLAEVINENGIVLASGIGSPEDAFLDFSMDLLPPWGNSG